MTVEEKTKDRVSKLLGGILGGLMALLLVGWFVYKVWNFIDWW